MPRANRFYRPGYVWHVTHRCHRQEFLLKFDKDKRRWVHWLFEAKKRFGLCVLNYMVTSNHIHLLVYEKTASTIPKSLQLIAGRVGQEYNTRKQRKGAFWEDRYRATLIDKENYFIQCMVYIDLNMVRAGVVSHPADWPYCGYREIMNPKQRYSIIDLETLFTLFRVGSHRRLREEYEMFLNHDLCRTGLAAEPKWSESVAVGSKSFILNIQETLGLKTEKRRVELAEDQWVLHETGAPYN